MGNKMVTIRPGCRRPTPPDDGPDEKKKLEGLSGQLDQPFSVSE
ncbi:MAG: hypothetical protein ACK2T4_04010 [Candidatus Promineifilaceae bacterium]